MAGVSVTVLLTPCDNKARVLDAVESVRAQSLSDALIVVQDDGSADDTVAAVRERFGTDGRLRVETGPRRGRAAARNAALADVQTDWTAFLDVEDAWATSYLEQQLAALGDEQSADLVVAGCRYVGQAAGLYATTFDRPDWHTPDSLEALCRGAFAHGSSVVVRTSVARSLPFDETLSSAAELDWLFRLVAAGHRVIENRLTLVDYGARDGADEELSALEADEVRMRYADTCAACRRDPLDLIRRRARYLRRVGRRREARGWYWRWWRKKPDSTQALGGLLRCLFARK